MPLLFKNNPTRKSNISVQKDKVTKAIRRLRAQKMVEDRVLGMPLKEMALKYHIHRATVQKELSFAVQEGLVEKLEDRILRELVPLAIETYKHKMKEDKDAFVAKDVLTNLARLSEKQERAKKDSSSDTLEAYIRLRATKHDQTAKTLVSTANSIAASIPPILSQKDPEEVIEADVAAHSPTITELTPEPQENEED